MHLNVPNTLTLFRIVLIPVFAVVFYIPGHWSALACAVIYVVAAITDGLDGYYARKLGQSTPFGAFLDPVADKLMVAMALVLMVEREHSIYFTAPAMVIIGREIVISALREWMAELGKRATVAVSRIGKIKTTFQMTAIIVLLAGGSILHQWLEPLGYITLYLAAGLTLWSMGIYLRAAAVELGLARPA